jgi:hypothetical protein
LLVTRGFVFPQDLPTDVFHDDIPRFRPTLPIVLAEIAVHLRDANDISIEELESSSLVAGFFGCHVPAELHDRVIRQSNYLF